MKMNWIEWFLQFLSSPKGKEIHYFTILLFKIKLISIIMEKCIINPYLKGYLNFFYIINFHPSKNMININVLMIFSKVFEYTILNININI